MAGRCRRSEEADMAMDRRDFLQKTAGTALVTALAGSEWLHAAQQQAPPAGQRPPAPPAAPPPPPRHANDVILLGPDKIRVARMAIGTGTNSGNVQREMGLQGFADYLKFAFDQGQFFWDTADGYKTHPYIKEALKTVPREKVTIMTKTSARTAEEMKAALERYRQELGTDYIDILLLHNLSSANWPEERKEVMDVLSEAYTKGIIKTHGASIHTIEALRAAAKTPWCRVQLQGINPIAYRIPSTDIAATLAAMRDCKAAGHGMMGMKILGEGKMRNQVEIALRFELQNDSMDCYTIGAANPTELADLIKRTPTASVPLTRDTVLAAA
jgi:predicted aldo/keto reductase-like oxidoreductase